MFLHVSMILFAGGASVHAGIPPPWKQTPLGTDPHPHPPGAATPREQTPPLFLFVNEIYQFESHTDHNANTN